MGCSFKIKKNVFKPKVNKHFHRRLKDELHLRYLRYYRYISLDVGQEHKFCVKIISEIAWNSLLITSRMLMNHAIRVE